MSTTTQTTPPVPTDMHTLTPHLVCRGAADAIEFYKRAFGATEQARLLGADGKLMHAMLRIGDSALMLVDENAEWGSLSPQALGGTPVTIHQYVTDVDAAYAQALAAGATQVMPPQDMFWGDRYGVLRDPFGHSWSLATQKERLTMEQVQKNMESFQFDGACGQPDTKA